jgi:UDP-N-acetylglucosamine 2-epimerase (non-hydrolysing)
MKLKIILVVGARPNFMKIAPIYAQMKLYPHVFEPVLLHTGQHYDEKMSKVFFDDLGLPEPDIYLGIGSASHAVQTAEIMRAFEQTLLATQPDLILACALTAVKTRINTKSLQECRKRYDRYIKNREIVDKAARGTVKQTKTDDMPILLHVESGERSFDFSMPEEINRITTDILSDILFTTSEDSDDNLTAEGIDARKVLRVGNVMIDALVEYEKQAGKSRILLEHGIVSKYVLVTMHRPQNVDDDVSLRRLCDIIKAISSKIKVLFPVHPRTRKLLEKIAPDFVSGLAQTQIKMMAPVGYLDFLYLLSNSEAVITDSGGIQVETSFLGIPCLTFRPNTEWQITIREGTNRLVNEANIMQVLQSVLTQKSHKQAKIALWDGKTAERIVGKLMEIFNEV